MNVDRVVIQDDYATNGHRLIVIGRAPLGAGFWLAGATRDGAVRWLPIAENVDSGPIGIPLAEGTLDAIVQTHLGAAAPTPALERHLLDALAVRDRLLTLVEGGRS